MEESVRRRNEDRRREIMRKKRAARRRKVMRRRILFCLVVLSLVCGAVYKTGSIIYGIFSTESTVESVVTKQSRKKDFVVEKPVKKDRDEAVAVLKKLGEDNDCIQYLYENREEVTDSMLSSVANNPEMAEFVKGYITGEKSSGKGLTKKEKKQEFPLFLQWDSRWGYNKYGDSIIGMAGCGPTCVSMVVYALTKDAEVTPDVVAEFSEENGYYVDGIGTDWSLMSEGVEHFGIYCNEISLSESVMKGELDAGHVIICGVGAGDFTTAGHFIVIYGYAEDGFLVNDPNCIYRSGQKWNFEQLSGQIKIIWSYHQ